MAADDIPAQPTGPVKSRRSARNGVAWVLILVLFPALAWDYVAGGAHEKAVRELVEKVGPPDDALRNGVRADDVRAIVGNKLPGRVDVAGTPFGNGANRVEVYRWFSINPFVRRELYVYYGGKDDAIVLSASVIEDR